MTDAVRILHLKNDEMQGSKYAGKGQLISKGLFDVIVWTKKPTNFLRISALAFKKRANHKIIIQLVV